jgi:hypothetical protein
VSAAGADGTPVTWAATRGRWLSQEETLRGGRASATLRADEEPRDGLVSVSVAGAVADAGLAHRGAGKLSVRFEHAAIVDPGLEGGAGGAGIAATGTVTIDGLSGDVSHSYITATEAIVLGLPGERIDLAPGSFFAPNSVPAVHLAMNGIDEDAQGNRFLAGENGGPSVAVLGDVALDDTTAFTLPGQSLRLSGG